MVFTSPLSGHNAMPDRWILQFCLMIVVLLYRIDPDYNSNLLLISFLISSQRTGRSTTVFSCTEIYRQQHILVLRAVDLIDAGPWTSSFRKAFQTQAL